VNLRRRALASLAGAAALTACALPDQRMFGAPPYRPPVPPTVAAKPAPPPWPGPPPLATIRFDNPAADYLAPLRQAVSAAEARKPDVVFAVVGVAPGSGTPAAQAAAAAAAADAARTVMQAIERMGVPSERLLLASRTDPTVKQQQVEVYVR
jgi:ABC-type glycerol-3-phosphate transport system substrate-binding protein